MMKRIAATALVAGFFCTPAHAEKVDMSTLTCAQVMAASQDDIGTMLVWMHGYIGGQNSDTMLDLTEFQQAAKDIGEYCAKNPETSLLNAVQETMGEDEKRISAVTASSRP